MSLVPIVQVGGLKKGGGGGGKREPIQSRQEVLVFASELVTVWDCLRGMSQMSVAGHVTSMGAKC